MPEDIVYAIHDFVAENEDEITFHIGDSITVLEKDDKYMDGWWQVNGFILCCSRIHLTKVE